MGRIRAGSFPSLDFTGVAFSKILLPSLTFGLSSRRSAVKVKGKLDIWRPGHFRKFSPIFGGGLHCSVNLFLLFCTSSFKHHSAYHADLGGDLGHRLLDKISPLRFDSGRTVPIRLPATPSSPASSGRACRGGLRAAPVCSDNRPCRRRGIFRFRRAWHWRSSR